MLDGLTEGKYNTEVQFELFITSVVMQYEFTESNNNNNQVF
jgi:hypothetical protein